MKRYPKYKDSGVPWLGQVPEHWEITRLSRVAREVGTKNKGMAERNLLSLSYGRIIRKDIEANEGLLPASFEGYQIVEDGDTVLRLTDLQNDQRSLRTGYVTERGIITSAYSALRPMGLSRRWLFNVLRASDLLKVFYSMGGGVRQSLDYEGIKRLAVLMPPSAEQDAIDAYLVAEEARIAKAIDSQERMIELLKERRSAIITQAVTKGLNPKAKMKDSGVPWLGQVPAHWEVRPLKSLAWSPGTLFIDGDWIESENISDAGIRYLTSGNVGEGLYKEQGAGFITPETFQELNCEEVFPRDVLISRLNLPIGRACVVPDLGQRIVTCVDNVILRTNGSFSPNFLAYLFSSKTHFDNMETLGRGSTMLRISRTTLGNVRFAFPPFNEQLSIVKYLDAVVAELDSTISSQERMIELLKERRSAIITQAVTGQIDVR